MSVRQRDKCETTGSPGDAVGIGGALAALAVGIAAAALLAALGSLLVGDSVAVLVLLVEVGLLVGVLLYLTATHRRVGRALRLRAVTSQIYALAIQLGLALLVANVAASFFLGPPAYDLDLPAGSEGWWEWLIFACAVVLVAPVVEESLFRGLLQGALESRLRRWFAIVLAAVPFALLHGPDPAAFFLLWSLPVGWVTWRTGSIRPGIVIHAVNNLVGAVGLLAADRVDPGSLQSDEGAAWFAALLLGIAALWSLRLCRRIGEQANEFETGTADGT